MLAALEIINFMSDIFDSLLNDFVRTCKLVKHYLRDKRLWVFTSFVDMEAEELVLIQKHKFQRKIVRIAQVNSNRFFFFGYHRKTE